MMMMMKLIIIGIIVLMVIIIRIKTTYFRVQLIMVLCTFFSHTPQAGSEQYALREQRAGHQRSHTQAEDRTESDGCSAVRTAAR